VGRGAVFNGRFAKEGCVLEYEPSAEIKMTRRREKWFVSVTDDRLLDDSVGVLRLSNGGGRLAFPRRRPIFPHVSLSSRTRSAPAGFIEPCLSSPANKPPSA
jgi:hypothetical protein